MYNEYDDEGERERESIVVLLSPLQAIARSWQSKCMLLSQHHHMQTKRRRFSLSNNMAN